MIKCFQASQEPFICLLNLLSTYNMSGPVLKGIKNGKFSQGAHNLREEPGNFSDYTIKWLRIMRIGQQHWTKAWNEFAGFFFQRKCQLYYTELLLWLIGNAIHADLTCSHWMGKSVYEVKEHWWRDTRIEQHCLSLLSIELPIGIVLVALFGYLKQGIQSQFINYE